MDSTVFPPVVIDPVALIAPDALIVAALKVPVKVGLAESTTLPVPVEVVTPVPPFATFKVPLKTTLPDPEAGVKPVVPPLNVVTPEPILNAL